MSSKITGKEYPLSKIFSKEFDYYIPAYQRPYAWTESEAETLFDDLLDFFNTEETDNYFLGSIVLIKEDEKPHADVIDGQQRLTTLTILIAVIGSYLTNENRNNCNKYLREPGNDLEGLAALPRLHLRNKDQNFFNKYIQDVNITELLKLNPETLDNESQKLIRANCKLFIDIMNSTFSADETEIAKFCKFLVTRCYLVTVYTPSQQSAFRVFSVMNSRGLNLMPIDIIKSDIIGQIPNNKQEYYTDKWEDLEVQTTRSGFNDVFTHTRMIFAKSKAKQNLLEEFKEAVLTQVSPITLIDDILEPYAEAYTILVNKNYAATINSEKINKYLFWLNKIDNSDWLPSAIRFFAEHKNEPNYVLWFIAKLERLASFLHITSKDINKRIDRYKLLLEEMENNPDNNIDDPITSIELTNNEKKEFVEVLNGEIYKLTSIRRNFVILRLNEFVGDGATSFNFEPSLLTIEHVLPQTISINSEWDSLWSNLDDRAKWINRIANLVPLTRKKNSEAQNYDFDKKKDIYFKGKNGTTTYPLTTQVLSESIWSPNVVELRQELLLKTFKKCWELNYIENTELDLTSNDEVTYFYIKNKRSANCTGYVSENGFVVTKGSKISNEMVCLFEINYPNAYKLREELCNNEIIINGIFQYDYEFDSISLAASLVLGRNASGPIEWVDSYGILYSEKNENIVGTGDFNVNDETTYHLIKVGLLAFELLKKVLESGNITDEEVEKLKNKDYSKELFNKTNYPVLANNRTDNRGNSNVIRYRKTPINFKGKDVFITTQWFVGNRKDLIKWYKKHI